MKQSGAQWAVRAQIARRGGFLGAKLISAPGVDGFAQSLREADQLQADSKRIPSGARIIRPIRIRDGTMWTFSSVRKLLRFNEKCSSLNTEVSSWVDRPIPLLSMWSQTWGRRV